MSPPPRGNSGRLENPLGNFMSTIPQETVECLEFRPYSKNTLQGFATLRLPAVGLTIKECTLHAKSGARWIGFPGRPWTDKDGNVQYANLIEFATKEQADRFRDAAVQSIDAFRAGTR